MTIAEIHGKISSHGGNLSDRLEDLLTSDVFGPLRYLPFAEGLQPVLSEARLYSSPDQKLAISDPAKSIKVYFWPRLENSEPDVLVECGGHLLLIEAKYLSGKSGSYDNEDEETAKSDQLRREFVDLMQRKNDFSKLSLVYLTADRTMPAEGIKASQRAVQSFRKEDEAIYEQNTYWLSWYDVRQVIQKLAKEQKSKKNHEKNLILQDIESLLHRKGLRGFEGFCGLNMQKSDAVDGFLFYKMKVGFACLELQEVNAVSGKVFYQRSA